MPVPNTDWRPSATLDTLRLRASVLARLRQWFAAHRVLEVETPALSSAAASDPNLNSMSVTVGGRPAYLHTSPEFAMKRLLAAGSGDIYQIARVFRDGESGRLHGPEFTMVEWYRVGATLEPMMDDVEAMLRTLAEGHRPMEPASRLSYREAFRRGAGVDPISADRLELIAALDAAGIDVPAGVVGDKRGLRDLLLATVVEPALDPDRPTFVHDFPVDQAALARIRPGSPPLAARFELFLGGMEIANGFDELVDATEQRRRCSDELATRHRRGLPKPPLDDRFLAALAAGLPQCSGVAVGFDRLLMWIADLSRFSDVVCFDTERA